MPEILDSATSSGMHLWGEDVVVPLGHVAGDIEGAPLLRLQVAAEGCRDADLNERLSLEHSDGHVEQLTEGRLRLSPHTHADPQPLPTEPVEVLIEMLPTSVRVPDGCRLRLGLSARRVNGVSQAATLHAQTLDILPPVLETTHSATA